MKNSIIGLGFKETIGVEKIEYHDIVITNNEDHEIIKELFELLKSCFDYDSGNSTIDLSKLNLDHLIHIFKGFPRMVNFFKEGKNNTKIEFITIVSDVEKLRKREEFFLIESLFSS